MAILDMFTLYYKKAAIAMIKNSGKVVGKNHFWDELVMTSTYLARSHQPT
jgi:hypothetical protein